MAGVVDVADVADAVMMRRVRTISRSTTLLFYLKLVIHNHLIAVPY